MRRETLLKIISLFRYNLDRGFTILEISKKLQIGYRPAYNHIAGMAKENMVRVETVGKAKQCFLNIKNEKSRQALAEYSMLKKEELLNEYTKLKSVLEAIIKKLTQNFISEIHSIVLFGSYSKGQATKSSDIDLLFIVADMKSKGLRRGIESECASFQYSHNIKVSPIITDISEFKKMLASEGLNIGKEAKEYGTPIYGYEQFWRLAS